MAVQEEVVFPPNAPNLYLLHHLCQKNNQDFIDTPINYVFELCEQYHNQNTYECECDLTRKQSYIQSHALPLQQTGTIIVHGPTITNTTREREM